MDSVGWPSSPCNVINFFRLPTLNAHQTQSFPLPGAYLFRFKTRLDPKSSGPVVWMDVTEDAAEVPSFDHGLILAKVTRLSAAAPPATAAGNHTAARGDDLLGMGGESRPGSGRVAAPAPASASASARQASQQQSAAAAKPMGAGGGGSVHQAPEADPFGLFVESSGGSSSSSAPSRPPPQQQQPQPQPAAPAGGRSAADLLSFDAFGAPTPPPMMQVPRPMMGGPGGPMRMPQPGPGIMGGMPPRGGMPRGPPSYPPTGSSGVGWM